MPTELLSGADTYSLAEESMTEEPQTGTTDRITSSGLASDKEDMFDEEHDLQLKLRQVRA